MTPQEQAKKIEEIYNEAIEKLNVLGQERANLVKERQDAIRGYIKDLETKKVDAIRTSLGLSASQ
jgi:DNA-binding transcriptional regulator YiaG